MDCNYNILIITLDSCRWDVFDKAHAPNIKGLLNVKCAYTHGTYTLPAHLSIYAGIFPSVRENIPYYNRFSKQLIRIENRYIKDSKYLIGLPKDTIDIIAGLKKQGYFTFCLGAVNWFKNEILTKQFDYFFFTGIYLESQIDFFQKLLKKRKSPFLGVINIGETHEPYQYGGLIKETNLSRARCKSFNTFGFQKENFESQIKAVEFIDNIIAEIFNNLIVLNRDTILVLCGDHGECFGEDNLYGHGFYHPKIMEVPLAIGLSSKNLLK